MEELRGDRDKILSGIFGTCFLLLFFGYFFFFITGNAITGKTIYEDGRVNISVPEIDYSFNINTQKIINFILVFILILSIIVIIFYVSRIVHKKINHATKIKSRYSPFKSTN